MHLLLDECIDRRLAPLLEGHRVRTVPQMGWAGIKNGELLSRAQKEFDVFLTIDRSLPNQQHMARFDIAVLIVRSPSSRLDDLKTLVPAILSALSRVRKRRAAFVGK